MNRDFRLLPGPLVTAIACLAFASVAWGSSNGAPAFFTGSPASGENSCAICHSDPPGQGSVYFDDVPMQRIGLEVVRENVATVLQHPALFNDSVRMNLTLDARCRTRSCGTHWRLRN